MQFKNGSDKDQIPGFPWKKEEKKKKIQDFFLKFRNQNSVGLLKNKIRYQRIMDKCPQNFEEK